jgi:glycosyltransferase involved in cell wall biosynthesis
VGFDPEFGSDPAAPRRLQVRNLHLGASVLACDEAIVPTHWQASCFPPLLRERMHVIHDGIRTDELQPDASAWISLGREGLLLSQGDEVVTFVNRNLEPYRGYHIFMRALPQLLKSRPQARVLMVGGDDVSYGARPDGGQKWKDIFAAEVRGQISDADWSRVHFLGHVPYQHFIPLLQLSTVHVYLTYPFVLSWSLLEAMSAGCAIVASDTQPLHEVITHNETGRLVDFFDPKALAQEASNLLDKPQERQRLGANARAFAQQHYDLQAVCLPRQLKWVEGLVKSL